MASNQAPEDFDPLLDEVLSPAEEPQADPEPVQDEAVKAAAAAAVEKALAESAGDMEPGAGDSIGAALALHNPSATTGAPAAGVLASALDLPERSALDLAREEETEARLAMDRAEGAARTARQRHAIAARRVAELTPAPSLQECNAHAAKVQAALDAEKAERGKVERVVYQAPRRPHPPLPGVVPQA